MQSNKRWNSHLFFFFGGSAGVLRWFGGTCTLLLFVTVYGFILKDDLCFSVDSLAVTHYSRSWGSQCVWITSEESLSLAYYGICLIPNMCSIITRLWPCSWTAVGCVLCCRVEIWSQIMPTNCSWSVWFILSTKSRVKMLVFISQLHGEKMKNDVLGIY